MFKGSVSVLFLGEIRMIKRCLVSMAAMLGLASGASADITAEPIPVEAFARVPNIQSVSLSREGDLVVAIVAAPGSDNGDTALATWNLADAGSAPVITPSGDRMKWIAGSALKHGQILAIGRQEWTGQLGGCGEGRVTGATATFVNQVYLTDATHGEFEEAFETGGRALGIGENLRRCLEIAGTTSVVSSLPLDPDRIIISRLNPISLGAAFYRMNLRTGEQEFMFRGGGRTSPALFDRRDGTVLAREELEPVGENEYENRIYLLNPETGEFEVHETLAYSLASRHTMSVAGRDEASGQYYIITDLYSDLAQVYAYDPATRSLSDGPILAHPRYSITGLIFGDESENSSSVMGFRYGGPRGSEVYWLDGAMNATQEALNGLFPDAYVSIMDTANGLNTILFSVSSGAQPPAYYIFRNGELQLLGHSRPWIDSDNLADSELIYYEARDGLRIPGILDLPAGWTPEDGPLPTIIHPHGGPWARDTTNWDASGWVPFLTSRGYAVLRPQYRGSTGFGLELWRAGDRQWGLAMQDDKDDGAAWLVEQGIADPDRIAMFGYSYGGFASIAAVVRENSPYQCAIAGAGVADLGNIGNNWSDSRIQRAFQGRTVSGMDPILNTDQANIPIFLFHGDRDVRVPLFHSRDFYNAVRNRVDAELMVVDDMPHSLPWYPRHHREFLTRIESYLANDCGPGGL